MFALGKTLVKLYSAGYKLFLSRTFYKHIARFLQSCNVGKGRGISINVRRSTKGLKSIKRASLYPEFISIAQRVSDL